MQIQKQSRSQEEMKFHIEGMNSPTQIREYKSINVGGQNLNP